MPSSRLDSLVFSGFFSFSSSEQLIRQKSAPFKPEKFENHYQAALQALVEAKRKGKKVIAAPDVPRSRGGNVVDLMEALRQSVGNKKAAAKSKAAGKTSKKSA